MTLRDEIHSLFFRAQVFGWTPEQAADETLDYLSRAGLGSFARDFDTGAEFLDSPDVGMCDWPVEGRFRQATCGRTGATRVYGGIRLCWQHEDTLINEALSRMSEGTGKSSQLAVDALARISFRSEEPLMRHRMGDLLDNEVAKRIESMADSEWLLPPDVERALDALIEKRIAAEWGESA